MTTKEIAKTKIQTLVSRFEEQYDSYKNSDYNEMRTRRDFIDPFFKALGWDMDNGEGVAEAYREVIQEDSIKVKGQKHKQAPDYSFRLTGGQRLFFVEAKKPSISIKDNFHPAYQVRRYGWSAKLPVSIVTDFEEFSVYNCSLKPKLTDRPSVARIKLISFKEYLNEFDFIWDTFSRESIRKGKYDEFLKSDLLKKGTKTVDDEFLESLDNWRKILAVTISWKNKSLNEEEISYSVQQLIDRLIFIRIAEARSVEPYGSLKEATKKGNFYNNLFELFKKADEKYNSGLFNLKKDKLSDSLIIDNKIIKDIVDQLYPPISPFEFSVIPVEILGSAYERFLGKQIKVDFAHRATIEEKPEVRKAGGVYYTPQFVVDFIIASTVGAAIYNKKPSEINKLRIVDPACGSGSFLLGAYKYLLEYHKSYYIALKDSIKHDKNFPLTPDGNLTTIEKKRILLNNIYGVDIDVNAVEVTKLSLLIKCLEGETEASIDQQLKIWHERILPTLENNIKSGNSIIDLDFYSEQLDFGEEKKINPFNWQNNFNEIFKQGGFDIVIGNPPYGADFSNPEKSYLIRKFKNQNYQLDSYLIFLEHSINNLLKSNGLFGMIIPNPWLTNLLQKDLRKFLFSNTSVIEIIHFKKPVFPKVTVDTEIVILENAIQKNNTARITVVGKDNSINDPKNTILFHKQKEWQKLNGDVINIFLTDSEKKLIKKSQLSTKTLDTYLDINVGIKPYQVGKGRPKQTKSDVDNRIFDSTIKKDKFYRQYLRGSDINQYYLDNKIVRFIKFGEWLAEPRPAAKFDAKMKIFMRQTGDSLIATLDDQKLLCLNNMHVLVPKSEIQELELKCILGIINSKLLNWIYQNRNPEKGEALAEVKKTNVANLPIRSLNEIPDNTKNEISSLVDQLLKLNKELSSAKIQSQIDQLKNKIDFLRKKIDNHVYQLYDLDQEEIKQIEKE